jgi:general secretion pathway protein C
MLAIAAYFQASGLGQLVGALLAPASAVAKGQYAGSRKVTPASDRELSAAVILERNAFDSITGPIRPPSALPGGGMEQVSPGADPYKDPLCDVPARVVLIASSDDPAWSFAAITGPDGKAVFRRRGEEFFGGRVDFIGSQPDRATQADVEQGMADRVWLTAPNGMRCQLQMGLRQPQKRAMPQMPPPGASASRSPLMSKIHRVSDHEFEIDRSAVEALIANPAELMKTRVVPEKVGDQVVGMKLFGIKEDSLLGNIGLQNGDRLQSLNGFDMNDPQKMLEAYTKLLHADHISASVMRNGQPVNLDYSIK